jgi:hypothetical protein
MRRILIAFGAVCLAACASAPAAPEAAATVAASSPPLAPCTVMADLSGEGTARDAAYMALDSTSRTALLLTLPDCLEHPDPALRDGYGFEFLSLILRGGEQTDETLRSLKVDLLARLASANEDKNGFRGPFTVLALAEVARVDRITPFLSEEERWDVLMAAKAYLEGLTDYRGYSDTEGWRHGVAHTADLLMQMSLNAHLTKPQAEEILASIALKVGTPDHAYIYGESERLAAPVTYLAFKETFTAEEWSAWFAGLWPPEDPLREDAYKSEAALTKLHNLRAFAQSVYINAVASNDDRMKPVAGAAFEFLNQLP